MNHSPLFLATLNRLIGRTMRQLQLAKNADVRFWLKRATIWLNRARKAFVSFGSVIIAKGDIEEAMRCVGNARLWAKA